MKTVSTANIGLRVASNALFLLAFMILGTFGIGGDEWETGMYISGPFFVWSLWLQFKANHTATIRED